MAKLKNFLLNIFTYIVLREASSSYQATPKKLAIKYGRSVQGVNYYFRKLAEMGYLAKVFRSSQGNVYRLSKEDKRLLLDLHEYYRDSGLLKKSSWGVRARVRLHGLKFVFPVVRRGVFRWDKGWVVRNWEKRYSDFGNVSVEETSGKIVLFVKEVRDDDVYRGLYEGFKIALRFGGRLIDQAMNQLVFNDNLRKSRFYSILGTTAFFTGLRSTEIRYLVMNKSSLETRFYKSVAIIELNYLRPHKKAVVTMLPKKLYQVIPESYVGVLIDKYLRGKGLYISLMRKVHRNILSRTMDEAEIDLLQGRLAKVIVVHYTKHIYDIAGKYEKAYQPYYKIIDIMMGGK